MTTIDDQIKAAFRNHPLDDPGIIEMAISNFRGRQRFVSIASILITLAMIAGMIWCAVGFFHAAEVREMILFAVGFLFLSGAVAMLKLWFWLMMIRYSIARELKRLELQVGMMTQPPRDR